MREARRSYNELGSFAWLKGHNGRGRDPGCAPAWPRAQLRPDCCGPTQTLRVVPTSMGHVCIRAAVGALSRVRPGQRKRPGRRPRAGPLTRRCRREHRRRNPRRWRGWQLAPAGGSRAVPPAPAPSDSMDDLPTWAIAGRCHQSSFCSLPIRPLMVPSSGSALSRVCANALWRQFSSSSSQSKFVRRSGPSSFKW